MLKRREALMAGAGVISGAWLGEGIALAADEPAPPSGAQAAFLQAVNNCIGAGQTCLQHCFQLFAAGDASLAKCAEAVNLMLAMCRATGTFTVSQSRYRAQVVQLCTSVCEDCERECRKHEKEHAICKACADACNAVVKAAMSLAS